MSDQNRTPQPWVTSLVEVLVLLPEADRKALTVLLADRLSIERPHELRYQRLGLLAELVRVSGGEFVLSTRYDAERAARPAESWPGSSTLIDFYGCWDRVFVEACRHASINGMVSPSASKAANAAATPRDSQSVLNAIDAAARETGCRCISALSPSMYDYWVDRRRWVARLTHKTELLAPVMGTVKRRFGTFHEARDRATVEFAW